MTKSETKQQTSRWQRWWPYLWQTTLKLCVIGLVALCAYAIYLDARIKEKFEGQRWQVPIQVFSHVATFDKGEYYSANQFAKLIRAYGYKKVANVMQPGQYSYKDNRFTIYRRGFDFGEGMETEGKFSLTISKGKITRILNPSGQNLNSFRLDPTLLERIVSGEKEDRVVVPLQNVPEKLLDTLLLVEDRNFYYHSGVSITGIARAFISNIKAGRTVQGGSTLTQQLAKNMFLTREKKIWRKISEAIMALLLEFRYSKDQILEAYINEVYVGQHYANGVYGFGLAAKFYFGQTIESLSANQMAMLIGQVKGPSFYDPWRYPDRAKKRRDLILKLMVEHNIIDEKEFERSIDKSLTVRKSRRLSQTKHYAYMQLVKQELAQHFNSAALSDGIRVFTGFSPLMQQEAQLAVSQQLNALEKGKEVDKLETAMLVTDIDTGAIRAVIGGRDNSVAGFNRAIKAQRAIGSLIKPVVFLSALERYEQYNFATPLLDEEITLTNEDGVEWTPKNYDGTFRGQVTLVDALVQSLNIPTVNLGLELGLESVREMLAMLGHSYDKTLRPSLLLGAIEMSPQEVNQLYLSFASAGHYRPASVIEKLMTTEGETLWQNQQSSQARLSSQGSYLINYALKLVAQTGTARSLKWRLNSSGLAGKTGTTNNSRDSWYVGYDKKHLVTTWIGRDDNKSSGLTGSSGALTLYANFMKRIGVTDLRLSKPDGIEVAYFDPNSGVAIEDSCEGAVKYPVVSHELYIDSNCGSLTKPKKKKSWFERLFGD